MKPRIRTIKPEAHIDEDLWDLEQETGLPIFRAFSGLWCHADREGRFEWRPRPLKAGILPYWDGDFSRVLDALASRGFVRKYTSDGRDYGVIDTFGRHQFINGKEPESELPAPPEASQDQGVTRDGDASATCGTHVEDVPIHIPSPSLPVPDPEGVQGEPSTERPSVPLTNPKRAPKAKRQRGVRKAPPEWEPGDDHRRIATEERKDFDRELAKFRDHEFGKPKTDWDATFRNWLRNSFGSSGSRPGQAAFNPFDRVQKLKDAGL